MSLRLLLISFTVLLVCPAVRAASSAYVDKVVMSMGVQGDSNGVIGPQLPHGSINPSADTAPGGHGGYKPGRPIRGFSQLHVSGTGWGTYGQFLLSPQLGLATGAPEHDSPATDEIATPAYYAVTLARYGIRAEFTPTHHAAIYRFTYPASADRSLVLDLAHSIATDVVPEIHGRFLGGELWIDPEQRALSGFGDYAGGFNSGAPYRVFFYAVLDTPFEDCGTWSGEKRDEERLHVAGTSPMGLYLRWGASPTESRRLGAPSIPTATLAQGPASPSAPAAANAIMLKIAVSFKSIDHAREYLRMEIPRFDFVAVRRAAEAAWNEALGAIEVAGATPAQEALFYTALYHSFVMPRDRTGDNPAWDSAAPFWDDQYAVWDTWRTKFPLMCLIRPNVVRDNIAALYDRLMHRGEIGDSFVFGDDGPKQGGDDVDAIIAEAYATGVEGIDWSQALTVLRHNADKQRYPEYLRRGWISEDQQPLMACSNTLECAYNDACAARVADALSREGGAMRSAPRTDGGYSAAAFSNPMDADAARWRERSKRWEQVWNPQMSSDGFTGFIQPRQSDGTWIAVDPKQNFGSWHRYFYEANSWTYSLFVPHDFARLIALCGGSERFTERVDHAFVAGLVELANEPSFMAARAFNYAGRPDRNAFWTHTVMTKLYTLKGGYPGNEDSGAMGSWYVFSALGFFPNAGQGVYLVNGPFCPKMTLTMEGGRKLIIEASNGSDENIYVQSMTLNGKRWDKNWFTYADIKDGARLEFVMGPKPSAWGTKPPFAPSLSDR